MQIKTCNLGTYIHISFSHKNFNVFNGILSAGRHVSATDGGDAAAALASYLEGSSLVSKYTNTQLYHKQ